MDYAALPEKSRIEKTIAALASRGIEGILVKDRAKALQKIKDLIPAGASVQNGSSRTLEEIGFVEILKNGAHPWNNLHDAILKEADPAVQALLRKQSVLSDFYLGSVHAVAETGELVFASNSGSQLPHLAFTSPNIVLVCGTQKITPDLTHALERVEKYVLPLEDERMKSVGMGGSAISKLLIINREPAFMGRKFRIIFVEEKLGF